MILVPNASSNVIGTARSIGGPLQTPAKHPNQSALQRKLFITCFLCLKTISSRKVPSTLSGYSFVYIRSVIQLTLLTFSPTI